MKPGDLIGLEGEWPTLDLPVMVLATRASSAGNPDPDGTLVLVASRDGLHHTVHPSAVVPLEDAAEPTIRQSRALADIVDWYGGTL